MSDEFYVEIDAEAAGDNPVEAFSVLDDEQREKLGKYLKEEYDTAASEMEARNARARKWRTNLEAFAANAPKHHPFKNSSNVTVPVTQTITQALSAKVVGTFDAREPLWDVQSVQSDEELIARFKVVAKFLNMLAKSPTDLNMPSVMQDLVNETVLIGGCFPKVTWATESWRIKDVGGVDKEITYKDGPEVVILPVERVKYRRGISTISRLPWIGLDTALTEHELRKRASEGLYDSDAVATVLEKPRTTATEDEAERHESETFDSGEVLPLFDVTEFWVFWDVDGTGVPVDLFITMHVDSGTILREQYNVLGMRSVTNAKYIHRSFGLTGRGVGQMTESAQDEVTAIHNMRNDNMKLANTRLIIAKRGGPIKANEEIFPGKILHADNPDTDVRPFQLGEIYPSSLQAESNSMSYAQRAVGLSDSQMGFADQTMKSRDTVRGQAMRIQQGDSILGSAVSGIRDVLGQIGMLVWIQCVANKERVLEKERMAMRLDDDELNHLAAALDMTVEEVPMKMAFSVKVTDAERTFEQQRNNLMMLTQLYAQYGQQVMPLAMQVYGPEGKNISAQNPELFNFMGRMLTGSSKLLEDIFRFFNIHNVRDYVPNSDRMDQMFDMLEAMLASITGEQMGMMGQAGAPQGMMPAQGEGMPEGQMMLSDGGVM